MRHVRGSRELSRDSMRGITLIELIIVVGLVGILASIATPAFRDMTGRYRLNSAAKTVVSGLKMARMIAVSKNTRTRMVFTEVDPSGNNLNVARGVYRVERLNTAAVGGSVWEIADGNANVATLPDDKCLLAGKKVGELCWDLKESYPWVSLTRVDPVGGTGGVGLGNYTIDFGPDGFVTNSASDFRYGTKKQDILVVLTNKHATGKLDHRLVLVDRAGGVRIEGAVSSSIPVP